MRPLPFPLVVATALAGCSNPSRPAEGFVHVPGGKIYFAQMGTGPATPLIVIHGGPGSGSYGLKPWGAGGTPPKEYQAAVEEYYHRHVRRLPRRSTEPDSGGFGALVYNYMWGPNEFTAVGTLKHFDARDWIQKLTVPTLFVTGEFDEATPASTAMFAKLVPEAEFKVIPNSGHATENDNPDVLLSVVRDFLRRADRR